MSSLAVNAITDASGGTTASINGYTPSASNMAGRNRIINGDCRIDQRNAGAAVTASGAYPVDRFINFYSIDGALSWQQDSSAPAGFINSAKFTTTTADTSLGASQYVIFQQRIEGTNVSDLAWGTASAKTVTLSFWVRSSLTGTFGGSLMNSGYTRAYPFSYTISAADTWEQKTITIAGDTTGTWLTTNGIGIRLSFGLGIGSTFSGTAGAWASSELYAPTGATSVIGTLNATWYITGVQLEEGSVATPFENRLYGTELALCQRYYMQDSDLVIWMYLAHSLATNYTRTTVFLPTTMRANPTMSVVTSGAALDGVQGITPNMFTPYINGQSGSSHILSYTASAEL